MSEHPLSLVLTRQHQCLLQLAHVLRHALLSAQSDNAVASDVRSADSEHGDVSVALQLLASGLVVHARVEEQFFIAPRWPKTRWPETAYEAEHGLLEQLLATLTQNCAALSSNARSSSARSTAGREATLHALQHAQRLEQVMEHHFLREERDWMLQLIAQHAHQADALAAALEQAFADSDSVSAPEKNVSAPESAKANPVLAPRTGHLPEGWMAATRRLIARYLES